MKYILILLLIIAFISSPSKASDIHTRITYLKNNISNPAAEFSDTSWLIINAPANTYGYEIVVKDRVLIHQISIPGRPGITGFKKKSDAKNVALLVLKKLSKGIMPPSVEQWELKELKINF